MKIPAAASNSPQMNFDLFFLFRAVGFVTGSNEVTEYAYLERHSWSTRRLAVCE